MIIQVICIFNLYFTFLIKNGIILLNGKNEEMLKVLDKVKTIAQIVLISVIATSVLRVSNNVIKISNNANCAISTIKKTFENGNINETTANLAQITKNLKEFTGKDLESIKKIISKLDEKDVELIRKVMSNCEVATEDVKEITKIIKDKVGLRGYGFFSSSSTSDARELIEKNPTKNWYNLFVNVFKKINHA